MLSGNTLNGRIQLTNATVGPAALRGEIRVEAGRDAITLRPGELVLSDPNLENEGIHLTAGAIRITREAVTVEQLAAKSGTLAGLARRPMGFGLRERGSSQVHGLPGPAAIRSIGASAKAPCNLRGSAARSSMPR